LTIVIPKDRLHGRRRDRPVLLLHFEKDVMFDVLPNQLPWFVAGPALGVLIVALFALANQPLGASDAYVQTLGLLRRRSGVAKWRVFYFAGLFIGGFLATNVLRSGRGVRAGYDAVGAVFSLPVTVVMVFIGAIVLGYGAAVAGGCTSGHGMCGTAQRSPASIAVTATFMATAVAVTFVLRVLTGGSL
jgi:uncharacterized membrane protein YedE/YeeE